MTTRWYAVHAYSNFENKVADSIREQAKQRGLSSLFEDITRRQSYLDCIIATLGYDFQEGQEEGRDEGVRQPGPERPKERALREGECRSQECRGAISCLCPGQPMCLTASYEP